MPEPMTSAVIAQVEVGMTQLRYRIFTDMVAKMLDITKGRVKCGWPTRGETVEECG
jgi:hypothetical protein